MSSQAAFIVCPLVLSSVYSLNRKASFYGSAVIPFISAICVTMMLQMPGSRNFGKSGKEELPVVAKPTPHTNESEMKEVVTVEVEMKENAPVIAEPSQTSDAEMKEVTGVTVKVKEV